MWCILFGVGVLLWGQLITTIPTKRIPKQFSWGSGPPEEIMDATSSLVEDGSSGSLSQDVKRTGQILWIRGLTRLQTQVCLIQLHNSTVSQQAMSLSSSSGSNKRQSLGSPSSPTTGLTTVGVAAAVLAPGAGSALATLVGGVVGSGSSDGSGAITNTTITTNNNTITDNKTHPLQQQEQQSLYHNRPIISKTAHQFPTTIQEAPELPGTIVSTPTINAATLQLPLQEQEQDFDTNETTILQQQSGKDFGMVENNNHLINNSDHQLQPNRSDNGNTTSASESLSFTTDQLDMR